KAHARSRVRIDLSHHDLSVVGTAIKCARIMPKFPPSPQHRMSLMPKYLNVNQIKPVLAWLLVLLAVGLVVAWIGPAQLIAPWLRMAPDALILALLFMVLSYVLRAVRIQRYFMHELRGQFWLTLKLSTWHVLLNNFLPMRTGEISFPVLMQRYFALPATRTVPVLLWFRLLDLQAIVILGLIAVLGMFGAGTGLTDAWLWPVLVLVPAPFFVYLARGSIRQFILRRTNGQWQSRLLASIDSLPSAPSHFLATLGWTWANWLIKLLTLAFLLKNLAPVTVAGALAGAIGGDLTTVLPIHAPGGFGTFEAGVVLALQPFNLPAPMLLSAAINLHLFLLGTSLLAGLLVMAIRHSKSPSV
ncbi:MAG: lysylphosphatidylglycerol synthase transmembrane domain-containing protein, partial [Halothiobacillus sp.]